MFKSIIAGGFLALSTVAAQATTIDFEALSGDITGDDLGGVAISQNGATINVTTTSNLTLGILGNPDTADLYRADFTATDTTDVSVDIGDFNQDADDLILEAYDVAGNLIASDYLTIPASFDGMETLTVMATDISYILFGAHGLSGFNNVYADNLVFSSNVASVPLPATGLMLLSALGLVGAKRRRK